MAPAAPALADLRPILTDAAADPCPTCTHSWHGQPCRLRVTGYAMERLAHPDCACPGVFGIERSTP